MIDLDIEIEQGAFVLRAKVSIDGRAAALFGPSGAGKTTIAKLLEDAGEAFSAYQDQAFRNLTCNRFQLDEIWGFIGKKQKHATALDLPGERFGLIAVPMQTIQLLENRAAFLRAARAHLVPGGFLAAALADDPMEFEGPLPTPDVLGPLVSQPVAVRVLDAVVRLERVRNDGTTITQDVIELQRVAPADLEAECSRAGLTPLPARRIAETDDHVGSTVVIARA